jgi:polysaccharide pyruvyl transferase WcaK-like protein
MGSTAAQMEITQAPGDTGREVSGMSPRIALVTPYDGGNLGDAAIQDAMILNLRRRIPGARFFGITLNCDNFVRQHGEGAFPLMAASMPVSNEPGTGLVKQQSGAAGSQPKTGNPGVAVRASSIRRALRRVPGLVPFLKRSAARMTTTRRELHHCIEGYRFLRGKDLLIISGGGQLDDEYGGAWYLPFAICKWILLARLARVPCAMASVGAGMLRTSTSRGLISLALRMCTYRSYRETRSRAFAASILSRAKNDLVVPDLAFSLPESELPAPLGTIRAMARGRPVIALSPMAYVKPVYWPKSDHALYERYVRQLALALSSLCRRGCFLVVACSSMGDDESVIPDLLAHLGEEMRGDFDGQIYFPAIKTWRSFVAVLRDTDYLIATRLHATILGFVSQTPAVAISYDPKVDWVMEDLHQTDYLLHFDKFTAEDLLRVFDRIKVRRDAVVEQIASYRKGIFASPDSARQYDFLAGLALRHHQCHP